MHIQFRVRHRSRDGMMLHQDSYIPQRGLQTSASHGEKQGEYSAGQNSGQKNLLQMAETGDAGDRGHELDIARAHAAGEKEEEKDRSSNQAGSRSQSHLPPPARAEMEHERERER